MRAERRQLYGIMIPLLIFGLFTRANAADAPVDNAELKTIFDGDQKDCEGPPGNVLDWGAIGPRDAARRKRVRESH